MTTYKPINEWVWSEGAKATEYLSKTVHEEERKPRFTGLLDASGTKLYAVEPPRVVGFVTSFKPPNGGGRGV